MKSRVLLISLVLSTLPAGCLGDGDGDGGNGAGANAAGATTTLCPGISGMEALGWDYYNGVIVTDPVFPPPVPVGNVYVNSQAPILSFTYPSGWVPTEITAPQTAGVDLIREDGRAAWRYVSAATTGVPTAREVRDQEVAGLLPSSPSTPTTR